MNADRTTEAHRVAVIGAGIAGLAAARSLAGIGCEVRVFERGRGVGGRTAHRRADPHGYDHGAQYFTARDPELVPEVAAWTAAGVVAPWRGRIGALGRGGRIEPVTPLERFVGVPGMNAMAKHLARGLDVHLGREVSALARKGGEWTLEIGNGERAGSFDAVALAMPPVQAARLTPPGVIPGAANAVQMLPCWCAMAAFDAPLAMDFDGVFVNGDAIDWAARDSSKPGRAGGERWVLHATPGWSAPRLDEPADAIASDLLAAFFDSLAIDRRPPVHLAGHRWTFARPHGNAGAACLWDPEHVLVICGDWCPGGRVEGAFLSGVAGAARIAGAYQGTG